MKTFTSKEISSAFEALKKLMNGTPDFPYIHEMLARQTDLLMFYSTALKPDFNENERKVATLLICLIWGVYRDSVREIPPIPASAIRQRQLGLQASSGNGVERKQFELLDFMNHFMDKTDDFQVGLTQVRSQRKSKMFDYLYIMIDCFENIEPKQSNSGLSNAIPFPRPFKK